MPTPQTFSKLLELPLFQGMSRNDLTQVVAHTRFEFIKYPSGKTIIREGDPCTHLTFLVNGSLNAETKADDHSYSIIEELYAPDILQAERIFGLNQRYTKTFVTGSECNMIRLSKAETMTLSDNYEIFRLNLLNIISTHAQKQARIPWRRQPKNTKEKITRFVETHCKKPAGKKTVRIKMERLANEIGESRLNVSHTLNDMQKEGFITLHRSEINIPALEKLLM